MPGTTPVYGFPYPEPTDLVADYPSLGQELAEDIEAVLPTLGGVQKVAPTSIANTGGTATLTSGAVTFSGVTTVSLNGVFTTAFQNHLVIFSADNASDAAVQLRLRASGTNATTNYSWQFFQAASTTVSGARLTSQSEFDASDTNATGPHIGQVFLHRAASAASTAIIATSGGLAYSGLYRVRSGGHSTATAYDGFTLLAATGSITGTVRVYGFAN